MKEICVCVQLRISPKFSVKATTCNFRCEIYSAYSFYTSERICMHFLEILEYGFVKLHSNPHVPPPPLQKEIRLLEGASRRFSVSFGHFHKIVQEPCAPVLPVQVTSWARKLPSKCAFLAQLAAHVDPFLFGCSCFGKDMCRSCSIILCRTRLQTSASNALGCPLPIWMVGWLGPFSIFLEILGSTEQSWSIQKIVSFSFLKPKIRLYVEQSCKSTC